MPCLLDRLHSIRTIYTHDGRFHFDEVLAAALLRVAGCSAPVVRTRVLPERQDDPALLFVDVGLAFDDRNHFDHHQAGALLRDEYYHDGRAPSAPQTPYCAAGLVWRNIGAALAARLLPDLPDERKKFFGTIDQRLLLPADFCDNGVEHAAAPRELGLAEMVAACNSDDWYDGVRQDCAFERALSAVQTLLDGYIRSVCATIRGEHAIREAFEKAIQNGRDFVLLPPEAKGSWREILLGDDALWQRSRQLKAVISSRSSQGTYSISMLPLSRHDRFVNRYSLPAGLKRRFPEFVFVHSNGFIGILRHIDNLQAILGALVPAKAPSNG